MSYFELARNKVLSEAQVLILSQTFPCHKLSEYN